MILNISRPNMPLLHVYTHPSPTISTKTKQPNKMFMWKVLDITIQYPIHIHNCLLSSQINDSRKSSKVKSRCEFLSDIESLTCDCESKSVRFTGSIHYQLLNNSENEMTESKKCIWNLLITTVERHRKVKMYDATLGVTTTTTKSSIIDLHLSMEILLRDNSPLV